MHKVQQKIWKDFTYLFKGNCVLWLFKRFRSKKVISAPSFRLSGKGWYETDFKTGSKKNLVQSEPKEKKAKPEKKESTKKSKKVD